MNKILYMINYIKHKKIRGIFKNKKFLIKFFLKKKKLKD